jgi:chemotaxis regulatin CheY-phosphate phosphatase CheZ
VVDLIFVSKAADGAVTMREMSELIEEEPAMHGDIAGNLMGLLTAQDLEQLTGQIPPDTSAFVVLLEHTWVIGLTEAIRKGEGVVFAGGLVSHEVLAHVSAELAAAREDQDA